MRIIESFFDLLSITGIALFGFGVVIYIARSMGGSMQRAALLYWWHTLLSFVFAMVILSIGGDAIFYYERALEAQPTIGPGTSAVILITILPAYIMNLSFMATTLFFNVFGAIGLISIDNALQMTAANKSKMVRLFCTLFIFLPSLSFWTAGIGKDSISILGVGLLIWSMQSPNSRKLVTILSFFLLFIVRPHIAGIALISYAGVMLASGSGSLVSKILMTLLAVVCASILVPFALDYAGVGTLSFSDYVDIRQNLNRSGGSSVDISSMNLPMQLFTYVFRPTIFEVNSVISLLAAIDNLVLLCAVCVGLVGVFKRPSIRTLDSKLFLIIYSMLTWVVLALTTANLGIAMRQKWMFVPVIIIFLVGFYKDQKSHSNYMDRSN